MLFMLFDWLTSVLPPHDWSVPEMVKQRIFKAAYHLPVSLIEPEFDI